MKLLYNLIERKYIREFKKLKTREVNLLTSLENINILIFTF